MMKRVKIGKQYRSFLIERAAVSEDKRTVSLAFSSEEPVERYWGMEILDHSKKSVNLRRLKRGGALLIDHDMRDQVGVIEEVSIDEADRKGRAVVRFGRSAKAEEIFQDVLDEIRSNVSVGYQIHDVVLESEKKDGPSTYRATRWEPYEISFVSVPADVTVGVGRDGEDGEAIEIEISEIKKEERTMEKEKKDTAPAPVEKPEETRAVATVEDKPPTPSAQEMEKGRKLGIERLCKINKVDEKTERFWIDNGISLEGVANDLLNIMEERGKTNPQPRSKLGLTDKETQSFSLIKAINACSQNNWTNAPFELECSRTVSQKLNQVPNANKFYVPFEVLERPVDRTGRRDIDVATAGAAGYLVGTDNVGFIEMLRNRSVAFAMGARRLSGLTGSVTVPRQSAAATAYWLATEATGITESEQTFVQMALTPKNVGAYTEISRQLLLQSSPGAEGIVSDDLAQQVALAADLGALQGSGASGQPTGITNTVGIGAVTGTSLAAAGIIELMTDVATANVTPMAPGFVTPSAVAGLLMDRPELTTTGVTRLWKGNLWNGSMFDIRSMSSQQLTAATMLFGDWQELVIAEWGVLEVETNPYANFAAGIVGVRAIYSMDVGVRRPFAFSLATGIT